jgi:hypothetical protein
VPSGSRNGFWKGGRVIDPRGYVLVRVGVQHHLSDCRGYAYEHRLVAERKLGRRLRPGELVHHKNEKKTDNRFRNLEVMPSQWEHRVEHRHGGKAKRLPGERNPVVACACGCGQTFKRYDGENRERKYVPGHNRQAAPTIDAILRVLRCPTARSEIIRRVQLPEQAVAVCLSKMKRRGLVAQVARGIWRRARG